MLMKLSTTENISAEIFFFFFFGVRDKSVREEMESGTSRDPKFKLEPLSWGATCSTAGHKVAH